MCHRVKLKKTKSIIIITDEIGRYCYYEIPIQAFAFDEKISFKFEDRNADMLDELCDNAQLNEN